MNVEEWRDIPGWEGFYQVSDLGRVKSLAREVESRPGVAWIRRERILSPTANADGYLLTALFRNGDRTRTRSGVHRLVLLAFVGSCPDGMQCCHNDGNPSNNALSNVRWDTPSKNQYDRIRHGTQNHLNKTHCPQGHPYSETNTWIDQHGWRKCMTCNRVKQSARNARLRGGG